MFLHCFHTRLPLVASCLLCRWYSIFVYTSIQKKKKKKKKITIRADKRRASSKYESNLKRRCCRDTFWRHISFQTKSEKKYMVKYFWPTGLVKFWYILILRYRCCQNNFRLPVMILLLTVLGPITLSRKMKLHHEMVLFSCGTIPPGVGFFKRNVRGCSHAKN